MNPSQRGIFIFLLTTSLWRSSRATGYERSFCTNLKPQNVLDMNEILGNWYGAEIVQHLREDDDVFAYDTCPKLRIAEISYDPSMGVHSRDGFWTPTTESHIRPGAYGYDWTQSRYGSNDREYHSLQLHWEESGHVVDYFLKFNNTRRGFWISSGPRDATRGAAVQYQYDQFTGVIQVMESTGHRLVLTFCHRLPRTELFSVILSREPNVLSRHDVHGVHGLLNRRDLSTSTVRKVCRNGSSQARASLGALLAFFLASAAARLGKLHY